MEFGDWANRQILAPSPSINRQAPGEQELLPLGPSWIGPLTDVQLHGQVERPVGYRPQLPAPIHLKRAFAQYDVTYEFKEGKLITERHLKTLMQEVGCDQQEPRHVLDGRPQKSAHQLECGISKVRKSARSDGEV
jgi:hypothetical protein